MTTMQKIVLLLSFWLEPPSAIKAKEWEKFTSDSPMEESVFFNVMTQVIDQEDEWLDWSALEVFKIKQMNNMGIAH